MGRGGRGWERAATSNSIPQDNEGLTTEEERAVQARRPPGREREKAVLVRVHHHYHHYRHHRHHLHDRPPTTTTEQPGQQHTAGRKAEPHREGGTKTGNPILTAQRGWGHGDQLGAGVAVEGALLRGWPWGVGTG